jgi:hypothetical protein
VRGVRAIQHGRHAERMWPGKKDRLSRRDNLSLPNPQSLTCRSVHGSYTSRGPERDVFTFSPNANGVGAGEGEPLIARTPLA